MIKTNEIEAIVKPYILDGKKPSVFKKSVDIYNHLHFHIDDGATENPYFERLIEQRRPNESESIKEYRRKIYLPKTKQPCFKVLNSLKKIVKSQDWSISYAKAVNPKIVGDEALEQYCEKNYPIFNSLENWTYSFAVKEIIADPNGLIYIEPKSWEITDGEKYEPVAKFVKTPNVLAYKEGELALFLSDRTNRVTIKGSTYELPVYIFITKNLFAEIKEINLDRSFVVEVKNENAKQFNCLKAGGIYNDVINGEALFNSFIDPMLPSLDAAARETSDLDAEVVQHIYSTFWYYSGNDCGVCNGTGKIVSKGQNVVCKKCEGQGRMLKSPYKDMVIGKEGLGENGIPTPPAGYIQKTTDIVRLQDERIKAHIFDALAALNMEFLAQTPLNQSGIAKEVDRDELNNYVYGVAYHIVENILVPIYKMINDLRYGVLVKSDKERAAMLPSIAIPEKYDLLSTNALIESFEKIKTAKIDSSIVDEYEVDIINKIFSNAPETRDKLILIKSLDPLKGLDNDEKSLLFQNAIITKDDYIVSTYISVFIDELLGKNLNFSNLDYDKQKAALYELAKTKEVETSPENGIVNNIVNE